MELVQIRPAVKEDKPWVVNLLKEWWAGPDIVTRGRVHHTDELSGFIALWEGNPAGLVTYDIRGRECEITSMNSLTEGKGLGTALVDAVKEKAKASGCRRLWLVTTNDNTAALKFWQRRGFRIKAIYPDAVAQSRKLKPEIPLTGNDGIPIRDEIELELAL